MDLWPGSDGMNEMDKAFANEMAAKRMAEMMNDMTFDQIRKLAELRESGILTEEEFTAKKTELLGRL